MDIRGHSRSRLVVRRRQLLLPLGGSGDVGLVRWIIGIISLWGGGVKDAPRRLTISGKTARHAISQLLDT